MSEPRLEIDGRTAAAQARRDLILALPDTAPRQLWLVDPDFADWPLDETAVLEALARWVRLPARRATWIAADFEKVERSHPRLAAWRRDYAHAVEAYRPGEGEPVDWPSWLMTDRAAVVIDDPARWRGRSVAEPAALRDMREAVDALLQRCEPAWPGRVLGL